MMYKTAILSALALCASVVVADEPDTTTTLTSTTTLTQTITLNSCGPEVPNCPIRTSSAEPTTSAEPTNSTLSSSSIVVPSNNATISIRPTGSKPAVIVTQTSFIDSEPTAVPSDDSTAGSGSVALQGSLLFGATLLGLVALN